jgi:PKD repeat protein
VGWLWTFGDGALSAARDPSHRYTTVDTYTVSLLITDSLGYTATQSAANAVVVRPACEPVAGLGFTYAPAPAVVRQTTTFTATYTSGVPAPTFSWNFDGGAAKAGPSVAYTFTTTGTHTVALTATNTCGATPYTGTVNVEPRRVYLPVVMRP